MLLLIPTMAVILILLLVAGIAIIFDVEKAHRSKPEPLVLRTRPLNAWDPEASGWEKIDDNLWRIKQDNMILHLRRAEEGWLMDADVLCGIKVLDPDQYEAN